MLRYRLQWSPVVNRLIEKPEFGSHLVRLDPYEAARRRAARESTSKSKIRELELIPGDEIGVLKTTEYIWATEVVNGIFEGVYFNRSGRIERGIEIVNDQSKLVQVRYRSILKIVRGSLVNRQK